MNAVPAQVQLALLQFACDRNPLENQRRAEDLIHTAASQGGQIVCLPELYATRYFCQTEDHCHFCHAEPIPGPTTDRLSALARRLKIVIVASLFEKRTEGIYHNSSVVMDADGSLLGVYRKMHIPDDPLYYEKFYFTPGDLGFRSFATRFGRIGTLICWDQWFPEAARLTALTGAQLIVYPTAIGWHPQEKAEFGAAQHDSWQLIQRSHAVANGCFVASINRVGFEETPGQETPGQGADDETCGQESSVNPAGGIEFWGQSFVCEPNGQVLAKASEKNEEILMASLNLASIELSRTHWPFFRDRRIDAYAGITRRFLDDDAAGPTREASGSVSGDPDGMRA